MARIDPAILARDAEWLVHRYDPAQDHFHLMRLTREQHRAATFLTDEYLPPDPPLEVVERARLLAAMPAPASLHFLFHSAFCGSTVLARAFDVPGVAMGLKEPPLYNDLVGWRRRGGDPARVAMVLDQGTKALAKPFEPGETLIVKPTNIVNSLADALLRMRPAAHALLLHAPIRIYLTSVAKKGFWGRHWARELLIGLVREGAMPLDFDGEALLGQTDLQAAAVGWLSQHAMFAKLVEQHGARVRTLDSETLLARPAEVIAALGELYGLGLDKAAVAAIVAGPAFTTHSKSGASFGTADRKAEYQAAGAVHGDEIEQIATWAEAVAAHAGIPMTLPRPLLG